MASDNMLFVRPNNDSTARLTSMISQAAYNNKSLNDLRRQLFNLGINADLNALQGVSAAQVDSYLRGVISQNKSEETRFGPESPYSTRPYEPYVFSFQNEGPLFRGPAQFYNMQDPNSIHTDRFVLPVPPSDLNVTVPNSQQKISTISGMMYSHAGDIDLEEVSFEGFFPFLTGNMDTWPKYVPAYVGKYGYRDPQVLVSRFTTAMRANQPIKFSVFALDADSIPTSTGASVIEPTTMSISSFNWELGNATGGTRQDVTYSMTLTRWRRQTISVSNFVRRPGRR